MSICDLTLAPLAFEPAGNRGPLARGSLEQQPEGEPLTKQLDLMQPETMQVADGIR